MQTSKDQSYSEPIISVRDVSKFYKYKHSRSLSLRQQGFRILSRLIPGGSSDYQEKGYKALENISFDVQPGEAVAIIGRNGAGKTTLIRLLANIMRPTTGEIDVNGRFAALIGLGTGFIPEMTGRENIYLTAAIYGLAPKATDEIIEDIIEFADIGDFIDRPVHEYSSGMRSRVGFSIAVHILPDVVMIDETLAVGDANFREKCDEKISNLLSSNRTLVLVSHNEADIRRHCERAIWLHEGKMMLDDDVMVALDEYHKFLNSQSSRKKVS